MKKIFLILALLTGFLAARADNTLTVTSGNPKILKEKTSALVVFDWEGSTWDHENYNILKAFKPSLMIGKFL